MDEREQALSMKRLRIELEHKDLTEKRNALYIIMTGIPIAFLTISIQLKYIVLSNAAIFVTAALEIGLVVYFFVEEYNRQLAEKRKELDELADGLLNITDEKEQLIVFFEKKAEAVKLEEQTEKVRHKLVLVEEILGKLKSPYRTEQDHGIEMARLFKDSMYE